jgi:hypothetical protein
MYFNIGNLLDHRLIYIYIYICLFIKSNLTRVMSSCHMFIVFVTK